MIRVSELDFFGSYSESANSQFTIAWSDSDSKQGIGGFRESGKGTYVLIETGKVLLNGKVQRPNDGNVANNGNFIINDWMFGEGLRGTFYAFDKTGAVRIKHLFRANLYNNGISQNGRYAVCQCANSDSVDGGALALFDLDAGALLWKKPPETGWADSYSFDCNNNILFLHYRDRGSFRYSFAGGFLDKEALEKQRIENATGFELSSLARSRFRKIQAALTAEAAEEIFLLFNKAIEKGFAGYPNEEASVHRSIGEIHEALGRIEEAIVSYETALRINPKVGLSRRLTVLKKNKGK
jgi:tetratricopeptide (TPR) repeat protein